MSALLGMPVPLLMGGSGSHLSNPPMSFMGASQPAPQPMAVQGPRLQDLSIQQLNALYGDPRVRTQEQRNKIGAMVQQKQMQAMQQR
jgi:hypothetical protein